eukprot:GHVL01032398.1.p1 GENE.GHVL01032398.1~~GHVL01032398.1.p1  ORF type:complete len:170 (+),score=31.79 GHVL01032398.1:41-550(+)
MEEKPQKPHRVKGAKGKKKKDNSDKTERHNAKAFTFSGGIVSVQRRVQRTLDKTAKKEHIAPIDKTPPVPPPFIVVVQGPPQTGKSTIIRSLAKLYSKHNLSEVRGSITLLSGRNRRLTFVECPNEVNAMIDLAKVADLVLLVIDGSFGFEMETFEFLSILQIISRSDE